MSRMADRILSGGVRLPPWAGDLDLVGTSAYQVNAIVRAKLKRDQVIEASNVCEFFYAGTGQEQWNNKKDFPNLAPPFPLFWIELRRTSRIVSHERGERSSARFPHCVGRLFEAFAAEKGHRTLETQRRLTPTEELRRKVEARCVLLDPSIEEKRAVRLRRGVGVPHPGRERVHVAYSRLRGGHGI